MDINSLDEENNYDEDEFYIIPSTNITVNLNCVDDATITGKRFFIATWEDLLNRSFHTYEFDNNVTYRIGNLFGGSCLTTESKVNDTNSLILTTNVNIFENEYSLMFYDNNEVIRLVINEQVQALVFVKHLDDSFVIGD